MAMNARPTPGVHQANLDQKKNKSISDHGKIILGVRIQLKPKQGDGIQNLPVKLPRDISWDWANS